MTYGSPLLYCCLGSSQRIYDPINHSAKVARVIGGYVEKNINNTDPKQQRNNTCAVRMSYILNQSGLIIPRISGQTVSGADKHQYFFGDSLKKY
jgi:hypothetical protein